MAITQDFYAFLCVATLLGCHCKSAPRLPAPSKLSYEWLDSFTVNLTWEKPVNLQQGCDVKYELHREDENLGRTEHRHFRKCFLTEDTGSGQWEVSVRALGLGTCDGWSSSPQSINVRTRKPRAEVVKDFKCVIESDEANCSWIPAEPSLNITLFYRLCGKTDELLKSEKECDHRYGGGGTRAGCRLGVHCLRGDVCVMVGTDAGRKTFELQCVIPTPKMNVTEDRGYLYLTWTPPGVAKDCVWEYQISYKECGTQNQLTYKTTKGAPEHGPQKIPYNKRCSYEFEFNVSTYGEYCRSIRSDVSGFQTYGSRTQAEPLNPVILVATILSIVLSVTLVLSCHCVRRHSAILCPIIPDPSAIFKEMMINGNKELKAATSLYTPVPEAIEPCKITLATENSGLSENS